MAAYICMRPKGSCAGCEHFRFDDERKANACMARVDKTPDVDHVTLTVYPSVRERYKALGLIS